MTEYINKAELKKQLKEETANEFPPFNLVTSYIKVVENMPIIDVVRCKECMYRHKYEEYDMLNDEMVEGYKCLRGIINADTNWFCADGERNTPPIVTDEITELNEENNKLVKENKELKEKLWKINGLSTLSVLDELHKEETK